MLKTYNLFTETELISFLVLYNFPYVFRIFTTCHSIWRYQLSEKFRIDHDADARTTTPAKMTTFTIL